MPKQNAGKRDRNLKEGDRKHLPMPTGPFTVVGCRDIMNGTSRYTGVLVRLFYPAANQSRDMRDHYLMWPNWMPHENYRIGYATVKQLTNKTLFSLVNRWNGDTFIPCLPNAKPLRDGGRKWPLLVFSHGMGGCRTTYASICLEFASHGFVVAAVEHRDASACCTFYAKDVHLSMYGSTARLTQSEFNLNDMREEDEFEDYNTSRSKIAERKTFLPQVTIEWLPHHTLKSSENEYAIRNKQIYQRVRECSRAVDLFEALNNGVEVQNLIDQLLDPTEFEGILDLDRIAVMGHSMGASTALMALTSELRFKVGVCLDAWMYPISKETFESLCQPILFVNSEKFQSKESLRKIKEIVSPPIVSSHSSRFGKAVREKHHYSDRKLNEFTNEFPERNVYTLSGTNHYSPSDLPFFLCCASMVFKRDTSICLNGRKHTPLPTGPLQTVGCKDVLTTSLLLRLYYPTSNNRQQLISNQQLWPKMIPHEEYAFGYSKVIGFNNKFMQKMSSWQLANHLMPCLWHSKPTKVNDKKLPVIVFSHGWGSCRTGYSAICIELASYGFIVAAIEHRDCSACATFSANIDFICEPFSINSDSIVFGTDRHEPIKWIRHQQLKKSDNAYDFFTEKLQKRAEECSETVDLLERLNFGNDDYDSGFTDLLDMERLTLMGHSFGGATTLLALTRDQRFKVGVCLDAWLYPVRKHSFENCKQPVVFINTEDFQTSQNLAKMQEIVGAADACDENLNECSNGQKETDLRNKEVYNLIGTSHTQQSDTPFMLNWFSKKVMYSHSPQDIFIVHDLTTSLSLQFICQKLSLVYNNPFTHLYTHQNVKKGFPENIKPKTPTAVKALRFFYN
ncbi:platelet-activating factor acetylhydrolase 2: cytoplasmic-like protein [Leptotrombidium deliense]|uniref:1-alkyl-2-acetylglycerophosphocholine esterase n=1 Tax=Leptotrombidium deliense TaxID=299467 RepID=A0A443SLV9_9ACAR|nr:platelet-activating factor acetylhydrolase 2: cytoplasmic-like protein [Leptotrombidium deliense]